MSLYNADPADMRKALCTAQALADSGILFFPAIVTTQEEFDAARAEFIRKLEELEVEE